MPIAEGVVYAKKNFAVDVPVIAREIGSAVQTCELDELARLATGNVCLEVGSWWGRSTVTIGSAAECLHSIDWHRGEALSEKDKPDRAHSLATLHGNLAHYGLLDKVVLHVGTTEQVCPYMAAQRFGFCFIDGDHTYEGVVADIRQVLPLMRPDAPIMFHDFTWTELGVQAAVEEHFTVERVVGTSAVCRVT